jgi:hypothetical protein
MGKIKYNTIQMGIIRALLDVNFIVESRPLTKSEEKAIRDFI